MKVQSAKFALFILLLAALILPALAACGTLEVGIENPVTPPAVAQVLPTNPPPANTAPPPTITPFPGQLEPGQSVQIVHIHMLTRTNGWAIGQVETDLNDHILFTLDGGHSWQDRTPPEAFLKSQADGLAATSYFGEAGSAWVAYASQAPPQPMPVKQVLWHTSDNGLSWQVSALELTGFQAEYFIPFELGFFDENHGWLMAHVGAGMSHDYIVVYITGDGGQNWQRIIDAEKNPELMGCAKTGLAFSTANNGWLVGNCPGLMDHLFFYTTTDGGQTWQPGSIYPPGNQPTDLFSSAKTACGISNLLYTSARSLLLTMRCEFYNTKQSAAWLYVGRAGGALEPRQIPMPFGVVDFINADEGWLLGAWQNDPTAPGEIYHTTDGGLTWFRVISTAWQGTPDFIDSNTGWVVAHTADKLALVFTSNGGLLWEALSPVIAR
jgi:photosystem II stability/assembly factor-like uncharacterized protein